MNKTPARLIVCALFAATCAFAGPSQFSSYYHDRCYSVTVDSGRLALCPKWKPEEEKDPPVSAGKALKEAKMLITRLKVSDEVAWKPATLSLMDIDGWLWRVRFQAIPIGGGSGPPIYMDCYVLMDGTVIEPVITVFTDRAAAIAENVKKFRETPLVGP